MTTETDEQVAQQPQNTLPTKSLSNWWRSFKNGLTEDPNAGTNLTRPGLFRASASSSAVPSQGAALRSSNAGNVNAANGASIPAEVRDSPIFGVSLSTSLKYASVRISLTGEDGESFVYGHVPVVIAKCAVFLKKEALDTEGIFRIPGSVRRIKVLQELFQSPPSFGKSLDWAGFNVHDAANLLKRYLASLPHPIIPRKSYTSFRSPLQNEFSSIRDYMNASEANGTVGEKPSCELIEFAITTYENLIFSLDLPSRQLLLYLIDLLSVFASHSEKNRMSAYNLASIFQPSVLTISEHDMNPDESQVSRIVIQFLIENSTTLLSRVQEKAIEANNLAKKNSENISKPIEDTTPGDAATKEALKEDPPSNPAVWFPGITLSSSKDPKEIQSGTAERSMNGTSNKPPEEFKLTVTPSTGNGFEPQPESRRHSKSMSSTSPPNLKLGDSSSKFPFFRRSSRQSFKSGSEEPASTLPRNEDAAVDTADALQNESKPNGTYSNRRRTLSPAPGEGEITKSRFRRSLMVLLPQSSSSRNEPGN